ncbi:unnamed protein product [Cuscuta epithymum]|uniref:Trichome birefringence-like N-terminal domain-containing protein n=1 Tax=Cuscuta epithymum TaxID=186058 RepID=A0AAV0C1R8_9ASTE|nr:unnamed protein product [Cuscuta epithymum]
MKSSNINRVTSVPAQGSSPMNYPKTLLSIVSSVGGLAMFLLLASSFLASRPNEPSVRQHFYRADSSKESIVVPGRDGIDTDTKHSSPDVGPASGLNIRNSGSSESQDKESGVQSVNSSVIQGNIHSYNSSSEEGKKDESLPSSDLNLDSVTSSSPAIRVERQASSECDLYHGKWIFDSTGPLYTNNSCPVITQMQNCQGNGRPDKDYENWRWKPDQCDLPRFNPKEFLELMRGKTLAFIGDSVARNQMESLLCILWQFEAPKNRGNKRMQRYYFRSTSTMIVRIWSSWLVNQTSEPFDFAPAGVAKLHLDVPDDVFMEFVPQFDVVVLSSGHWFAKQSVYILNNEIVGGQLWWPDESKPKKVNNIDAFGISVETILTAMVIHAKFSGLTIVRSFSPDHYEGGTWNTGGSCTGKIAPAVDSELAENGFTNVMHEKQLAGFSRAVRKRTNKSALKFMDITKVFGYRHDGHPGPYRSPDPNKITKRGPDGRPPPQDCLHWCMPGPVDTWNEMLFELIRREFKERQGST